MTDGEIEDGRNTTESENVWDSGIAFNPNTNTYKLMRAALSEADRIDTDLENIFDQHHINTATGDDLNKIGDLINLDRKSGESDSKYRARIKSKFRAATIGSTFDQFTQYVASVLNTDLDNVDILTNYGNDPAVVSVAVQSEVYDAVDLTASEIQNILGDGVPAGHEVSTLEDGTFRLKADGDGDDPDKGLTSDSISTGGTLATDLV